MQAAIRKHFSRLKSDYGLLKIFPSREAYGLVVRRRYLQHISDQLVDWEETETPPPEASFRLHIYLLFRATPQQNSQAPDVVSTERYIHFIFASATNLTFLKIIVKIKSRLSLSHPIVLRAVTIASEERKPVASSFTKNDESYFSRPSTSQIKRKQNKKN